MSVSFFINIDVLSEAVPVMHSFPAPCLGFETLEAMVTDAFFSDADDTCSNELVEFVLLACMDAHLNFDFSFESCRVEGFLDFKCNLGACVFVHSL